MPSHAAVRGDCNAIENRVSSSFQIEGKIPMKNLFSGLQRVGQSLMIPVSVLPAAGLVVALGRILQAESMPLLVQSIGKVFYGGGLAVFEQLPVLFAVGVAIGFSGGAGVAGLAAVAGYFSLVSVLKVFSEVFHTAMPINTGVFGGILMGFFAAKMYSRFQNTQLPKILGFFSGRRLVPIVTVGTSLVVALALAIIWPPIQGAIHSFGEWVMNSPMGPAFYAAGKRLLIPLGLHHVYYPPFLFEFGNFVNAAGQAFRGDSARYFAGDNTAGLFMASEFPIMLFGLPAAALAIYKTAPKQSRALIGGVMLSAALTSIVTGITEPIEFSFIFVAPLLFAVHVGLAFLSGVLTHAMDIHLGYTFSASLIDFGLGFFNQKNSALLWLVVGPLMGVLYFSSFYFLIRLFNFATPGREKADETTAAPVQVDTSAPGFDRPRMILEALGGWANIQQLSACITRLRVTVKEPSLVKENHFKKLGAAGVMRAGNSLQIVFGTESDHLRSEIEKLKVEPRHSNIFAPMTGNTIAIEKVPDSTFAEKMVGDGIAIEPTGNQVTAPFDGTVQSLFPTGHAIGLVDGNGVELLIHIGIDTVQMKGEGFKSMVKVGDKIQRGQLLIEFDRDLILKSGRSLISPIVVTNTDSFKNISKNLGQDSKTTPMLQVDI